MRYNRNNLGYTLVELMVATVVGMVLIAGATATFIVQNRSYISTESVSELNSQSKTALNIITDDIRNAGAGTPFNLSTNPINGHTSVIEFTDGGNVAPDSITVVGGFREIGNITVDPNTPLQIVNGNNIWIANAADRIDIDDRSNINIDGTFFSRIVNCNNTGGVCTSPDDFTGVLLSLPPGELVVNRPVYLVEDVTYCLNGTNLFRIRRNANVVICTGGAQSDTELIAQNIADLQFAYAVDNDNNSRVDIEKGDPNILDDADFINDGAELAALQLNPDTIRAVRVSILGISNRADPDITTGNPPAIIENRVHAATNDGFKRRLWQTVVIMRNMQE